MFDFLWKTMEQPKPFGLFHLIFFTLIIVLTVLSLHFSKNSSKQEQKHFLFICWLIMFILEVCKQIIFNYDIVTHEWKPYNFGTFPFQFCSLPLYLLPIIIFNKKESKFYDLLVVFYSTFVFFGGFGYFFFPVSFCDNVLINVQTMMHHGLQVLTGIFIFAHNYEKMKYTQVLKSTILLVGVILISMVLNVGFYYIASNPSAVNMFELSPINKTQAPVFSNILNATNYITFLIIYIFGFLGFASIVHFSMELVRKIVVHFRSNEEVTE